MKQSKVQKVIKVFSLVLAVVIMASCPLIEVRAAEALVAVNENVEVLDAIVVNTADESQKQNPNARTFLVNCIINVYNSSDGMLVDCFTETTQDASVIGVKDIKIQKKVWYGWKTVATSSGAESEDVCIFNCHVLYTGAELGETYRVSCVHYGTVDSYTEVENQTEGFIFTY